MTSALISACIHTISDQAYYEELLQGKTGRHDLKIKELKETVAAQELQLQEQAQTVEQLTLRLKDYEEQKVEEVCLKFFIRLFSILWKRVVVLRSRSSDAWYKLFRPKLFYIHAVEPLKQTLWGPGKVSCVGHFYTSLCPCIWT